MFLCPLKAAMPQQERAMCVSTIERRYADYDLPSSHLPFTQLDGSCSTQNPHDSTLLNCCSLAQHSNGIAYSSVAATVTGGTLAKRLLSSRPSVVSWLWCNGCVFRLAQTVASVFSTTKFQSESVSLPTDRWSDSHWEFVVLLGDFER